MRKSLTLFLFAAALGAGPLLAAEQTPQQASRWVLADDLRVRHGPGLDHEVGGLLQRGDRVRLLYSEPADGFCRVRGEGQDGYVACQYLSAEPVARPRAGQGDIPADRRWVVGGAVNLRSAPGREAEALGRLTLNSQVTLLATAPQAGYCEVQPLDRTGSPVGPGGFTACQFLAPESLRVSHVLRGSVDVEDTPAASAQAFWLKPDWQRLERYASVLAKVLPDRAAGPWPRDAELERMKAHLALGLKGPAPAPLPDWTEFKRLAAAHDASLMEPATQTLVRSNKAPRDLVERVNDAESAVAQLQGFWSFHVDRTRMLHLAQALEMPSVTPSYFRSESELAPPGDGPAELAGRFGGIYRTLTTPRRPQAEVSAGLYDMARRTEALTRPLQRVRLFRDGRLQSEPSHARRSEALWRDVDAPMCEGWIGGFDFGAAAASNWRYGFDGVQESEHTRLRLAAERRNPPGSLYAFYAPSAPPRAKALVTQNPLNLNREATGFVRATQLTFDLDGDGVPDLLVWEGVGKGPGHLGGETETDDPWLRVVLANINGAWKILGRDAFSYGCGC